jgi:hypothetical protein
MVALRVEAAQQHEQVVLEGLLDQSGPQRGVGLQGTRAARRRGGLLLRRRVVCVEGSTVTSATSPRTPSPSRPAWCACRR